jgi:uncharacterized protein YjiS (DUF1127 family)
MGTIIARSGRLSDKPLGHLSHGYGRSRFAGGFVLVLVSLTKYIGSLLERRRSRLALLEMSDEQLKDIGISRCDAHSEGIRPFWD